MKCDELGNVWVTGPGGVWVYAPSGELIGKLHIPEGVANLTWGGTELRTLQTVRKLQDLGIEWRKERAGRNFGRFRPIGRLMRPERASGRPHARG